MEQTCIIEGTYEPGIDRLRIHMSGILLRALEGKTFTVKEVMFPVCMQEAREFGTILVGGSVIELEVTGDNRLALVIEES